MKIKLDQSENIAQKIDSEGFDYYFCDYGPDLILTEVMGKEIEAYRTAKRNLVNALADNGVDIEI